MKKSEAEKAIRYLCHQWRKEAGHAATPREELHFGEFLSWVRQNYSSYLQFRTTTSVSYDAEMWFDQEFGQAWAR
jgi:hypothetical protein